MGWYLPQKWLLTLTDCTVLYPRRLNMQDFCSVRLPTKAVLSYSSITGLRWSSIYNPSLYRMYCSIFRLELSVVIYKVVLFILILNVNVCRFHNTSYLYDDILIFRGVWMSEKQSWKLWLLISSSPYWSPHQSGKQSWLI